MKMDMSAKPKDTEATNEGEYSQEQMEEMLEGYIQAKKIEADPQLFSLIKNYAASKSKMVEELFNAKPKTTPPKSIKDLKSAYNSMSEEDDGAED